MDILITVIQVLLSLVFGGVGLAKLTQPYAKLAARLAWVNDFEPGIIRLIGALEVCAAVGIIVPLFLHSLTMLTPLAGVGLALVMSGAMVTHLRRAEYPMVVGNLILLGLALFVAYGRLVGLAV
jgi:DoxX-like family